MIRIYIESRDKKRTELSFHDFIKESKDFVNGNISKNEVLNILTTSFKEIYDKAKHTGKDLNTMIIEAQPRGFENRYSKDNTVDYLVLDLIQQFITFYAIKLNDVLCEKALNKKWIKATGSPVYSDINLYGFLKESNSIIIFPIFYIFPIIITLFSVLIILKVSISLHKFIWCSIISITSFFKWTLSHVIIIGKM